MRLIALIVLLVVAGCNPYVAPDTTVDAAGFNTCNPGDPGPGDPSCSGGGGGGGEGSTCLRLCNSNLECGGSKQQCQFCNFGECRDVAPGLVACRLACAAAAGLRPVWCDFGWCGEVLRAAR